MPFSKHPDHHLGPVPSRPRRPLPGVVSGLETRETKSQITHDSNAFNFCFEVNNSDGHTLQVRYSDPKGQGCISGRKTKMVAASLRNANGPFRFRCVFESSHFTQIPKDAHEDHFVVECLVESFNLPMAMSAMYCDRWQEIPKTVDKRVQAKLASLKVGRG